MDTVLKGRNRMLLIYDSDVNNFADEYGWPCYDIHRLLAPWQITLFKSKKADHVFRDVSGTFNVNLIYSTFLK